MKPPYYAVIFTSVQTSETEGYAQMSIAMENLAKKQPGYLGIEHARSEIGITISYWDSLNAIKLWKENLEHKKAQQKGIEKWCQWYKVKICKVEHAYEFSK